MPHGELEAHGGCGDKYGSCVLVCPGSPRCLFIGFGADISQPASCMKRPTPSGKMIALPLLAVAMAQPLLAVAMAASTAALPPCLDRHEQCHMWAQIGECEVAAFMALNCPVSCGHACLTPGTTADSQALQQVVMLGARSDERIAFPGPRQAIAEMHAGELHLVLRLASGVVLTFGDDSMGQLGSPRIARATPVTRRPPSRVFWPPPYTHLRAVAVGAGRMTSGALLSDGALIMCHPGHVDASLVARDPVTAPREAEFAFI